MLYHVMVYTDRATYHYIVQAETAEAAVETLSAMSYFVRQNKDRVEVAEIHYIDNVFLVTSCQY